MSAAGSSARSGASRWLAAKLAPVGSSDAPSAAANAMERMVSSCIGSTRGPPGSSPDRPLRDLLRGYVRPRRSVRWRSELDGELERERGIAGAGGEVEAR